MKTPNKSKIYVTFWGTRGSISTPGRATEKYGGNTPCVSVRHNDTIIILDAGTGIRGLGLQIEKEMEDRKVPPIMHLFLSHTHWDHIQGLPFFQAAYIEGAKIVIYGSPNKEQFLESVLRRQMDVDFFPVGLSEMAADFKIRNISDKKINIDSIVVDWQEQIYHPGGSVRYRLSVEDKNIVYATDVELDRIFNKDFSYSSPENFAKDYLDFIQDADLLIADGQYTEEEYPKKVGWGHTSIPVIVEAAKLARVKQLAIFHHDPQHSDKILDNLWREYLAKSGNSEQPFNIFWAREGLTIAI